MQIIASHFFCPKLHPLSTLILQPTLHIAFLFYSLPHLVVPPFTKTYMLKTLDFYFSITTTHPRHVVLLLKPNLCQIYPNLTIPWSFGADFQYHSWCGLVQQLPNQSHCFSPFTCCTSKGLVFIKCKLTRLFPYLKYFNSSPIPRMSTLNSLV